MFFESFLTKTESSDSQLSLPKDTPTNPPTPPPYSSFFPDCVGRRKTLNPHKKTIISEPEEVERKGIATKTNSKISKLLVESVIQKTIDIEKEQLALLPTPKPISEQINDILSKEKTSDKPNYFSVQEANEEFDFLLEQTPEELLDFDLETLEILLQEPENIASLTLHHNSLFTPPQFLTVLNKTTNLAEIDLYIPTLRTPYYRWELNDPGLREMWVNNCLCVLRKPLHSPLLHTLRISDAAPGPLHAVLSCHPNLSYLEIYHSPDIFSEDFKNLSSVCTKLSYLLLHGERNNAGEGIAQLIAKNENLKTLEFLNTRAYSKDELRTIALATKNLKKLQFSGADKIDSTTLNLFKQRNPDIKIKISQVKTWRTCFQPFFFLI
jgi:hypothetical protein